ncbi:MAG TPA: hypothetical protein VKE51_21265 [Vicinamibacterales bacterium]|nr:hypothetical protein [Vicinamibacterales bacterium]
MQTLSQSVFILAFVLPPVALVLGAAALALMPRRGAKVAAARPQQAAFN